MTEDVKADAPKKLSIQRRTKTTVSSTTTGGKSKEVQVEVRKKRTVKTDIAQQEEAKLKAQQEAEAKKIAEQKAAEEKARLEAEKAAAKKEADEKAEKAEKAKAETAKPAKSSVDSKAKSADPEKEKRKAEEAELRRKAEELARQKAEEQARRAAEEAKRYAEADDSDNESSSEDYSDYNLSSRYALEAEDEEDRRNENRGRGKNKVAKAKKGGRDDENSKNSKNERESNRKNQKDAKFGKGKNGKKGAALQQAFTKPVQAVKADVVIGETITVAELANKMAVKATEIIKTMMKMGEMVTINQVIDQETAQLVAEELGHKVILRNENELEEAVLGDRDVNAEKVTRAPVVTIMGHVDHGKTSLLDVIRQTNVTAGEAGGITQHIGAYQVRYNDNKITFLDTPGHEAFTAMRLRGAKSTDIAVLVVAADDGVMPQTIEAINHAKSADVPIIVAINKMDKPGANPDHVKQQLSEHGLLPEEWGGDVIMVPVSAKQKQGIDDLLENILLVAEVMELKANPNRKAYGVVIEAQLDKGRGAVCTVLVQKGSLRVGDTVLAGTAYGKVRAMTNERGEKVKVARPSMPVEILGFSEVPQAGEIIHGMDDNEARTIAEKRIAKQRVQELQATHKVTLDDIFNQIQQGELKDLNIIIKADVQGSVEALRQSLEGIKNPEVRIVIVHAAVGAINESDIMLASASNAIVMGFNVRPDANVRRAAEQEKVDLRTYRVIYDAINDVESAMRGMLAPQFKEVVVGRAEVRQVISTPKAIVAGSYVTEGRITNDSEVRLIRDGIVVFEGKVDSLRRFKDEVKEVKTSFECGISLEGYRDIKEGDVIEAYLMEEVAPQI